MIKLFEGGSAIVESSNVSFTFSTSESPRDFYKNRNDLNNLDWAMSYNYVGDFIMHNYGANNDLPEVIRNAVQTNYIAPGIIKKKTQLLWGLGPKLYQEVFENKVLVRNWVEDKEIQQWLDSWDYETYLMSCVVDFHHLEGVFSKFVLTKGFYIDSPKIALIEHIKPDRCRLASKKSDKTLKATHALLSSFPINRLEVQTNFEVFPLFDFKQPFKFSNAILYSNLYSFCFDYYTLPDLYGSIEWLNRSTAVPIIFKALSKNSINLKFHIISPQEFWNKKKEIIEENCSKMGIEYNNSMLLDYQKSFLEKISEVLSGDENTGKYLHTTKEFTVDGTNLIEHGWEIKVIDQNIKDFVESQISISERADHALTAGLNVHSALSNVSESGKSDSGSEQLYALKTYLLTGIDIPEIIITKALNYAIKANFPAKNLKIGFYHTEPQREQDVSSKDRVKNQI